MKFNYLLVFLFISELVFGQSVKKKIEIANDYFNSGNYSVAESYYYNIASNNKSHSLYPTSLNKLGQIYLLKNDTAKAIETFKGILELDENKYRNFSQKLFSLGITPLSNLLLKTEKDSRLFYFPIKVSKNESCISLANIFMNKRNFRLALHYIGLSDSVFPYQHFCGNAFSSNEMYLAEKYAICYSNLRLIDSSLFYLAPYIFDNWLTSNSSIVDEMMSILTNNYEKEEYIRFFTDAENTIFIEKSLSIKNPYYNSYIILFNRTIQINRGYLEEKTEIEILNEVIEFYRNTVIFKKITSS